MAGRARQKACGFATATSFPYPRDCGVKHPNELAELFGKDSIPVQRRLIFPAIPQIRPSCGGRDIQRVNVAESGVGNKSPTK